MRFATGQPARRTKEADATAAPSRKNALGVRPGDFILGGGVLLLAVGLLLGLHLLMKPGARAVVICPQGESVVSLEQDGEYPFQGKNGLQVILQVEKGRIRFLESGCPDKVCVHTGWLSRTGQSAACLPAGILVRVEGRDGVDIVAG